MLPVVKEIIEILFKNGLIKVCCYWNICSWYKYANKNYIYWITKPSKDGFRYLESHEYKQQAGRSGRLGIDSVGMAIIIKLNNYTKWNLKHIVSGRNQNFESKLVLNYDTFIEVGINENCKLRNF